MSVTGEEWAFLAAVISFTTLWGVVSWILLMKFVDHLLARYERRLRRAMEDRGQEDTG